MEERNKLTQEYREYEEEKRERERRKQKPEKKVIPRQSPLPKSISSSQESQEVNVKISQVRFNVPHLSFLHGTVEGEFPHYFSQKSFSISALHFHSPKFSFKETQIDSNLHVTQGLKEPHVLQVAFRKPTIEFQWRVLDSSILKKKKKQNEFVIPVLKFSTKPVFDFKDNTLDASITKRLSPKYFKLEIMKKAPDTRETFVSKSRTKESKEIELPRTPIKPLEFLFGREAGALKDAPEPLIILFKDSQDDSYIHLFEEILIRIYREKKGGIPDIKKLTLKDEWSKREVERWLDEGKIFVVDIDSEGEINRDLLADRLWAIFHGRKGIVIFYTKDEKVFEKYRRLLEEVNWQLQRVAKIVEITPRKLSFKEKKMLTKLILGNIIVKDVAPGIDQDTIFNETSKLYEDKLEKLVNEYYHTLGIIREGENESKDHLRMKAFIVSTLIKELVKRGIKDIGEILERIRTEEPFGTIVPDVIFEDEFYEAETLFEEGFHKIHKTIQKYSGIPGRVKIVVEPITAFIHADDFLKLLKILKKRYPGIDVSFYTMDLRNMKLRDLRKYLKELSEFLSSNPNTS